MLGDNGKYWDTACNPYRIKCKCEVPVCWYHQMAQRFGWKYGFFPMQIGNINMRGKAKVFAINWSGDLGWKSFDKEGVAFILDMVRETQDVRIGLGLTTHTFLFLSKWPENLIKIFEPYRDVPGIWMGTTLTGNDSKIDLKRYEGLREFYDMGFRTWLSIEPIMGKVDRRMSFYFPDQIIVGHDSVRPYNQTLNNVLDIVKRCEIMKTPCFVKQIHLNGKLSKDPSEWPESLRVRELSWRPNERTK
jgi:protein gp37